VEQPHPRVVDTIEKRTGSATDAPSMYGILSLPDHHQLGLERLQTLVGVDTNNYLPQYGVRQGPEVTLRQTIALDVTPRQRAESLLPVRIDRLANAQQQQQPRIDYTTQMTMAPQRAGRRVPPGTSSARDSGSSRQSSIVYDQVNFKRVCIIYHFKIQLVLVALGGVARG